MSSMPPCLVYSQARKPASFTFPRCRSRPVDNTRVQCIRTHRAASSAVAIKQNVPSVPTANSRQHILTVLHKTRSLLPRILPSRSYETNGKLSLDFWSDLLGKVYDDLCPSPTARLADRVRIAIYGCDGLSGARELVTALLENPFASESQKEAIRSRWKAVQEGSETIAIQYGTSNNGLSDGLLQSAWLQQFGVPIEVVEFQSTRSSATSDVSVSDDAAKPLTLADIPIIVCNPAATPLPSHLSTLIPPLSHPNAILILTSGSESPEVAERVRALCDCDVPILFIDPARALAALRILSSAPSSPLAVQRYQDDFSGSNVSKLTEAITHIISTAGYNVPPSAVIEALHAQTAESVIRDSLSACRAVLESAQREVDAASTSISSLRSRMEEVKVKASREVFGAVDGGSVDEIENALIKSRRDIKAAMDGLTWWKLLWRVDDVGETLMTVVDGAWCKDLEYKLAFHAGRLASLQRSFTNSSVTLLASFPSQSPFRSPVLHNLISQISSAPTFPMNPAAFAAPLYARRQQLRFPTVRLQTTAHRALLGMGGSVFGGMGIAWAGWAGQLGIFDMAMQMETALGVGMLGALAGIRWAVGRFERAKKKWWKDYDRVGMGLKRDLKATLDQTINQSVLIVPEKASSGLKNIALKRTGEIQELKEEVTALEEQLSETSLR